MKLRYLFFTLIAVLMQSAMAYSQEQLSLRDRGDQYYLRFDYARAAEVYADLAQNNRAKFQDFERAADSYFQMRDFDNAELWYAKVVAQDQRTAAHVLRYGDVLKANGKYDQARSEYQKYASLTGSSEDVAVRIAGCDSALIWLAKPKNYNLKNQSAINTGGSEFSVSLIGDEFYYAGEPENAAQDYGWTGRPYLKLHRAKLNQHDLTAPTLAVEVLNKVNYHVGPVASPDGGKTLFVTQTYPGKDMEVEKLRNRKYMTRKLELFIYSYDGRNWVGEPFAYNHTEEYSVGHAAFSLDGKTLYFVSDRPGGFGGTDIWYTELQTDGSWGQPVNAGKEVNTSGNELFPVIGADGHLYYSSDGLAGMGGLDVFYAEGSKGTWNKPENMGVPLNSSWDDFSFVSLSENEQVQTGFISSNRSGGKGEDDIYAFTYTKPVPAPIVVLLQGIVTNKNTKETMSGAAVVLYDGNHQVIGRANSDAKGAFEFVVEPGKAYHVHGSQARFLADSTSTDSFKIIKSDTLHVALALEPELVVGKTFVLENLFYDFDKHNIRPDAAIVLDELVATMNEYPDLHIELSSHTDSRGNDAYNMALSDRRAKAAVDYLVSKGIKRDRVIAKGYGETRLVNECSNGVNCTEEQHQANRRTEVTILKM